jgi:SAM-dependent methyltransferase
MAPEIAIRAIRDLPPGARVVDPMVGSGTVAVLARLNGNEVVGIDSDPLAVLIADVWSNPVDPDALVSVGKEVLALAKARGGSHQAQPFDNETKQFIDYWFDSQAQWELGELVMQIRAVNSRAVRRALWCSFSRLIITKQSGVSRAIDVSHSRPHRVRDGGAVLPFDAFMTQVNKVAGSLSVVRERQPLGRASFARGDARRLKLQSSAYDLVVTSPPYFNAIDYLRSHRLTLVWMGHSITRLRTLRSGNVGTERGGKLRVKAGEFSVAESLGHFSELTPNRQAMVIRYIRDLRKIIQEIARILRVGGKAILVIGESTFRGVYLKNSTAIAQLGVEAGLTLVGRRKRSLPASRRYLPPPSAANVDRLGGRMRSEVVMTFRRADEQP